MTTETPVAHLWDLLEKQDICMLATEDRGMPRARPMSSHIDRDNGVIHFLTRRTDDKVEELHHDRDLNVTYVDHGSMTYISISGKGTVSSDPALLERLWDAGAEAWFGDENGKSDVVVITLDPTIAEYWNNDKSWISSAWEFGKGYFTDEAPKMGENAKVSL